MPNEQRFGLAISMYPALFATISGFSSRIYRNPAIAFDDRWIDFRGELELAEGEEAWIVARRRVSDRLLTWIGCYRFAHETTLRRGGHFGVGFWLVDQTSPGASLPRLLRLLINDMERLGVVDGQFVKALDAVGEALDWRPDLGKEVYRSLESYVLGGVSAGDYPTAMLDIGDEASDTDLATWIESAQTGPGLVRYQRLIVSRCSALSDRMRRNPIIVPFTQGALLSSVAQQLDSLQREKLDAHSALEKLRSEQERQVTALRSSHETAMGDAERRRLSDLRQLDSNKQREIEGVRLEATREMDRVRKEVEQATRGIEATVAREVKQQVSATMQREVERLQSDLNNDKNSVREHVEREVKRQVQQLRSDCDAAGSVSAEIHGLLHEIAACKKDVAVIKAKLDSRDNVPDGSGRFRLNRNLAAWLGALLFCLLALYFALHHGVSASATSPTEQPAAAPYSASPAEPPSRPKPGWLR